VKIEVTFDPATLGDKSGMVSVYSNAPNSPLRIALSGRGAVASEHSVKLKWKGKNRLTGYSIYRALRSGGPYAKLNSSLITSDEYTDRTLLAGETYYYIVRAVNDDTESEDSNEAVITLP
jgi:hypothetical protein